MTNLLEIEGYVFDTQELKDAYRHVSVPDSTEEVEYSEVALRAMLRYFADWSPSRGQHQPQTPVAAIEKLTSDEKKSLYRTFTTRLSENLEKQYSYEVDRTDLERFFEYIGTEPVPESFATFLLRSVWSVSRRIHDYRKSTETNSTQGTGDDGSNEFVEAIRRLPSVYLDAKIAQYEGTDKINGVRYEALRRIVSKNGLTIPELLTILDEENAQHETNIAHGYTSFTILGQIFYDYYKPRLDVYLDALAAFFSEETGVKESMWYTVNHSEPRHKLNDFAWLAIYPSKLASQKDGYQLYLGFHWDRLSYGLHVGDNQREGEWKQKRDLEQPSADDVTAGQVLAKFTDARERYHVLNDLTNRKRPDQPPAELAAVIEQQLDASKQVVFYGPPGTGKTFEAKRFADWWVYEHTEGEPSSRQVRSVTFHPSFSYEDFIEGLTASATESGSVSYQVQPGVLKKIAADASAALQTAADDEAPPPFVLIIDEINRGNLAQVFGEVITLLEADKREQFEVELAHSGETFTLPPNLYVIGTMNTADQSIALVDTALRRRFRFIDFPPDLGVVFQEYDTVTDTPRRAVTQESTDAPPHERLLGASVLAVMTLNDRILNASQLGKGKQLGHTYLLSHESSSDIVDAWRYDILPQLEEYYFGQLERLRDELLRETGTTLFDWETERIQQITDEDLYQALCELVGIDDPAPLGNEDSTMDNGSAVTESRDGHEDAWAAGERTPETFRDRIQITLDPENEEALNRLLDVGEEVGWLDAGRGDFASVMVKADAVDPGVGIIQLDQTGKIGFRWDWLLNREENPLTQNFIADAGQVFESVTGYWFEWNSDAGENGEFTSSDLNVNDLSSEDVTAIEEGLQSFVNKARKLHDE